MRDVLVVLPTYNEAASIEEVLRRVRAAVPDAGVLVVDDGSPDGTADIADRVNAELGAIDVMRRKERGGLGDAYRAGFRWGMERGAKVLVEMDSDLSHDPGALPELLAAVSNADLVIGSRYVPGGSIPDWTLHRRILSRWGNLYSSFMLGVPVRDMTSGYRAYRSSLLEEIRLDRVQADGYGFQIRAVEVVRRRPQRDEVVEDRRPGDPRPGPRSGVRLVDVGLEAEERSGDLVPKAGREQATAGCGTVPVEAAGIHETRRQAERWRAIRVEQRRRHRSRPVERRGVARGVPTDAPVGPALGLERREFDRDPNALGAQLRERPSASSPSIPSSRRANWNWSSS